MVWRMSPYERRRGGNAPPGGFRGRPSADNARSGQRGSGHSVATTVGRQPDTELGFAGPASWRRGEANSTASGRRVRQHRSFAPWGKARPEKWRAEPRPEPDSGNPTVRDRRGALRNVTSWEPGVRPGAKATEPPPDPRGARAQFLSRLTPSVSGLATKPRHALVVPRESRKSFSPLTRGHSESGSLSSASARASVYRRFASTDAARTREPATSGPSAPSQLMPVLWRT